MERGSLTEAARALGITQPAVSAALSRLEQYVGFALFRRDGRHVVPTAEAGLLHAEAVRALAGVAQLDEVVADIAATRRGHLTLASNPGPGIAWLPSIVAGFRVGRPGVTVQFLTRDSREVRSLVAARAVDLGLAEPPFDRFDIIVRRYRFPTVAVLPEGHPLCRHATITPGLLDNQDIVAMRPFHSTAQRIAQTFEAAEARFNVVAECEFFATALNLVRHGVGVCFTDPISAAESGAGLIIRPFVPVIPYEVAILKSMVGDLSQLSAEFAAAVDRHVSPFLQESLAA